MVVNSTVVRASYFQKFTLVAWKYLHRVESVGERKKADKKKKGER